ncbi:hypothetical protein ABAC460_23785 [Asticcacaulis sp. AC460]|uniref:hypothetical protein n=1 Tax=Asticcacaulis sp. AC460 TaxID=1282360 RepID=UPI0003C3B4BC|nr:hypothetical protein [Asticcacaulis sp. AC460]ESQ85324.1 hypothetical protein ABAC460_23785 [Asticcacaulis sp. AC460]
MRTLATLLILSVAAASPAQAGLTSEGFSDKVDQVLTMHQEANRLYDEAAAQINAGDLSGGCPKLQQSVDLRRAELPLFDELIAFATENNTTDQERFRKGREAVATRLESDSEALPACAKALSSGTSGHDPAYVATYNEQSELASQWAQSARANLEASGAATRAGDKASACAYLGYAIDAMDKRNAIYDQLAALARRYGYDDSVMAQAYEAGRADEMGPDGPFLLWYNNCPH